MPLVSWPIIIVFQSPQNRGYSSDKNETLAVGTTQIVSIPSESGLFLRSGHHQPRGHQRQLFQSPQNRGYSSDSACPTWSSSWGTNVSIPSESGLFLRSLSQPCCSSQRHSFQSPQNRGYSSDMTGFWDDVQQPTRFNPLRIGAIPQIYSAMSVGENHSLVSIPSESGLFLRYVRVHHRSGKTTGRFNPLRIGAIPQISEALPEGKVER